MSARYYYCHTSWPEAPGILLQVADRSTITHNEVSSYRYTGISCGWSWTYTETRSGFNEISHNNISTIGMGELCDLACVYHLGQDNGTIISRNLCTNVSSHGYGGAAYYTDAGSSNVTISSVRTSDCPLASIYLTHHSRCDVCACKGAGAGGWLHLTT